DRRQKEDRGFKKSARRKRLCRLWFRLSGRSARGIGSFGRHCRRERKSLGDERSTVHAMPRTRSGRYAPLAAKRSIRNPSLTDPIPARRGTPSAESPPAQPASFASYRQLVWPTTCASG